MFICVCKIIDGGGRQKRWVSEEKRVQSHTSAILPFEGDVWRCLVESNALHMDKKKEDKKWRKKKREKKGDIKKGETI